MATGRQFPQKPSDRPTDTKKLAEEICCEVTRPAMRTAEIRQVRRRYSNRLSKVAPKTVLAIARRLLKPGGFIQRFVAYELVTHHEAALGSLREKDILWLGKALDSWGAVDTFACYIIGPVWRERRVPDSLICQWARSKNLWLRRAALVSTVPLNNRARGGRGDAVRTLKVCRLLVRDREDLVIKALSWALRELSKGDPEAVRQFLEQHAGLLASRVVREVTNKLRTGVKNPRTRRVTGKEKR